MLVRLEKIEKHLRCPATGECLSISEGKLRGEQKRKAYNIVDGYPILIDFDKSFVDEKSVLERKTEGVSRKCSGLGGIVKTLVKPVAKPTKKNLDSVLARYSAEDRPVKALVIGGGEIGDGVDVLFKSESIETVSFDIYLSKNIQFVADAHCIPFSEKYFDVVVIQAVLEHVQNPGLVVSEALRVLKDDSFVFAETPFLQPVHEAAFDYTRFSERGHRFLFKYFDEVMSGPIGGPAENFMRAFEGVMEGVFRSRKIRRVSKAAVFWLKYIDLIVPTHYRVDWATGVYFIGKPMRESVSAQELKEGYKGAQK